MRFDANAPSGTTVTADGTNATKSTKVTPGTTLTTGLIPADTAPTCSDSNYTFMGWSESKTAGEFDGKKQNDLVGSEITTAKTYYAIWMKGDFWMSSSHSDYVSKSQFTSDTYYRSSTDIVNDIKILRAGSSNSSYSETLSRWNSYYSNDVRLHSTWISSDVTDSTSPNNLVEFRILQVGAHDGDGSVVTFMAAHGLPTAYAMNGSKTNDGSWANSAMRTSVMSNYVQAGLSSGLVTLAKSVNKVTTSGSYGSWSQGATTSDKFWLLSLTEVFGKASDGNTLMTSYFYEEGSRYAWFTKNGVNAKSGMATVNTALQDWYKTREVSYPSGYYSSQWWMRTPFRNGKYTFASPTFKGVPDHNDASYKFSVMPAFAF